MTRETARKYEKVIQELRRSEPVEKYQVISRYIPKDKEVSEAVKVRKYQVITEYEQEGEKCTNEGKIKDIVGFREGDFAFVQKLGTDEFLCFWLPEAEQLEEVLGKNIPLNVCGVVKINTLQYTFQVYADSIFKKSIADVFKLGSSKLARLYLEEN